jgi:SRSO17 transposase
MASQRIKHIILCSLKSEATPAQREALRSGFKALQSKISGIQSLTVNEFHAEDFQPAFDNKYGDRSEDRHFCCEMIFDSAKSYAAYMPHPAHQELINQTIRPITSKPTQIIDYVIRDDGTSKQ